MLTYGLTDLKGLEKMVFTFELGTPFKPFEQLMGVLPFASREHIPLAYQVVLFWFRVNGLVLMLMLCGLGFDVRPEFPDSRFLPPRF